MAFQDPVMPSEAPPERERKDWADYLSTGLQIAGGIVGGVAGSSAGPFGAVSGAMAGAGAGKALGGLFNPYSDTAPQQVAGGINTALQGGESWANANERQRQQKLAEQQAAAAQANRMGAGAAGLGGYAPQPTPQLQAPPSVYDFNKRLP